MPNDLNCCRSSICYGNRDDQDIDAVNAQNGARAIRAGQPAEDRPVPYVVAVADRDQFTFERQRATAKCGVGLAAENNTNLLADFCIVKRLSRLAVHHRPKAGVAYARREERAKQAVESP